MPSLELDGTPVELNEGDTIASALYRAGVRTFSRSFKYHRRRGLYCLSGDCPNCLVTVDGEPGVRACMTAAVAGQHVRREHGWPSSERDLLAVLGHLDRLLPVGFYYKVLARPRGAWPVVEPLVRRLSGIGTVDATRKTSWRPATHVEPDVLVVGAGVAGLAAALAAANDGNTVLVVDECRVGEKLAPGATRTLVLELARAVEATSSIVLLERTTAAGIYEGPLVPLLGSEEIVHARPTRVIVATGALEEHAVFPGNDLPGIWLGRGAARLVGAHKLSLGRRVVFAGDNAESAEHLTAIVESGADVVAALVSDELAGALPAGIPVSGAGTVVAARGRTGIRRVVVRTGPGSTTIACDALVLSRGLFPRDNLLRQSAGLPVVGAGDVVSPGCTLNEAVASGTAAASGIRPTLVDLPLPDPPDAGILCLCEDVKVKALDDAWAEGFRSTELLKRYATITMGPCQGALCHPHLRSFVAARTNRPHRAAATTARPPARPVKLADVAAGVDLEIDLRTSLHEQHLELGATMEWIGEWKRPERYGDPLDEYWAVRRGVSVMDVGTLGKFLVGGPDATEFLERLYPCHVSDIPAGRCRYALLLNESGFILDDGLICALADGTYYCTLTTGGAERGESWLRNWANAWGLRVHIANQTFAVGAINVAGPLARRVLQALTPDSLANDALPFMHHAEIDVAGIACRVIRLGFVGEISYELHHAASQSPQLWNRLCAADGGRTVVPHGLAALRLLRLEKGHILVGQDTEFDTTPAKAGMKWAAKMDKETFVGKRELERLQKLPPDRRLVGVAFDASAAPREGAPVTDQGRIVGHVTSARFSPVLGHGIGLAWVRAGALGFPAEIQADGLGGTIVPVPFVDPEGTRLRG